jgi:hypothetical protein
MNNLQRYKKILEEKIEKCACRKNNFGMNKGKHCPAEFLFFDKDNSHPGHRSSERGLKKTLKILQPSRS